MNNKTLLEQLNLSRVELESARKKYNDLYNLAVVSVQEKVSISNPERTVWGFHLSVSGDGIVYNTVVYDVSVRGKMKGDYSGSGSGRYSIPMTDFLMSFDEYKAKTIKEKGAKEQERLQKAAEKRKEDKELEYKTYLELKNKYENS